MTLATCLAFLPWLIHCTFSLLSYHEREGRMNIGWPWAVLALKALEGLDRPHLSSDSCIPAAWPSVVCAWTLGGFLWCNLIPSTHDATSPPGELLFVLQLSEQEFLREGFLNSLKEVRLFVIYLHWVLVFTSEQLFLVLAILLLHNSLIKSALLLCIPVKVVVAWLITMSPCLGECGLSISVHGMGEWMNESEIRHRERQRALLRLLQLFYSIVVLESRSCDF